MLCVVGVVCVLSVICVAHMCNWHLYIVHCMCLLCMNTMYVVCYFVPYMLSSVYSAAVLCLMCILYIIIMHGRVASVMK